MIIVVVVVLTTTLSVRSSRSKVRHRYDNAYFSRDTNLIGYSSKFCDRLSIRGHGESGEQAMLTLSLLKSRPIDTEQKQITFSKTSYVAYTYLYWRFHLLSNSKIKLNACLRSRSSAFFYLVKGTRNFAKWEKNKRNYEMRKPFSSVCQSTFNFVYGVHADDQYFLIFDNKYDSSTLELNVNVSQVLHIVSPDNVINNCSVSLNSEDSCSMPVAYSSSYTEALLQLEPKGQFTDWEANNVVHVRCHPRAWLYAVICISAAVGVAILITLAMVLFILYCRSKLKSDGSCTSNSATEMRSRKIAPLTSETANIPIVENEEKDEPELPPYNYGYNELPTYKP